jgi:hypothetical protein
MGIEHGAITDGLLARIGSAQGVGGQLGRLGRKDVFDQPEDTSELLPQDLTGFIVSGLVQKLAPTVTVAVPWMN